jgi:hypothetical protein
MAENPTSPRHVDPRRPPLFRGGSLAPFYTPQSPSSRQRPDGAGEPPANLGALLSVAAAGAVLSAIATSSVFIAWVQRMAPPRLFYMPTRFNRELVMAMPLLMRSYVPNLLSWNAHAAGFFGYFKLPGKRPHSVERVTLPDGGSLGLSWSSPPVDGEPVVVLLPGINNDSSMPCALMREGLPLPSRAPSGPRLLPLLILRRQVRAPPDESAHTRAPRTRRHHRLARSGPRRPSHRHHRHSAAILLRMPRRWSATAIEPGSYVLTVLCSRPVLALPLEQSDTSCATCVPRCRPAHSRVQPLSLIERALADVTAQTCGPVTAKPSSAALLLRRVCLSDLPTASALCASVRCRHHAALTCEVCVLYRAVAQLPASRLYAVGWSLGGGLLLRHMGEASDECLLTAAMAVSPAVDIHANYRFMASKPLSRAYLPLIKLPLLW